MDRKKFKQMLKKLPKTSNFETYEIVRAKPVKAFTSPMKGKQHSEETRAKMALTRKGKKQSEEHIKNRVEARNRNK